MTKHLPFGRESVDLIVGASVLEHLRPDDLPGVILEMRGTLSSRGCLALGYPVESFPVRLFFDRIKFNYRKHHSSKAGDIRRCLKDVFGGFVRLERLPLGILPSTLSFYETVLVCKSSAFEGIDC